MAITLQGALGWFLAEAMGKAAGAGVPGMVCPCIPIVPSPTDGPEPGGGYCLTGGPELCPIQALFLAPRGKGKESKERSCCSRWNLRPERIPGPAGPEKAVAVDQKILGLKGAGGGGLWFRGARARATDGAPLALYTHLVLANCSHMQRKRSRIPGPTHSH